MDDGNESANIFISNLKQDAAAAVITADGEKVQSPLSILDLATAEATTISQQHQKLIPSSSSSLSNTININNSSNSSTTVADNVNSSSCFTTASAAVITTKKFDIKSCLEILGETVIDCPEFADIAAKEFATATASFLSDDNNGGGGGGLPMFDLLVRISSGLFSDSATGISVTDFYFTTSHNLATYYQFSTGKQVDSQTEEGWAIKTTVGISKSWPQNFVFIVQPATSIFMLNAIHRPQVSSSNNGAVLMTKEMLLDCLTYVIDERKVMLLREYIFKRMISLSSTSTINANSSSSSSVSFPLPATARYSRGSIGAKAREVIQRCIEEREIMSAPPAKRLISATFTNLPSDIINMRVRCLPPCIAKQFDTSRIKIDGVWRISDHNQHPKRPMRLLILCFLLRAYEKDRAYAIYKEAFFGEDMLLSSNNFDKSTKYGVPVLESVVNSIRKERPWGCRYAVHNLLCPFNLKKKESLKQEIVTLEIVRLRYRSSQQQQQQQQQPTDIEDMATRICNNNNLDGSNNDETSVTNSCKAICTCYLREISRKPQARVISPLSYCYYLSTM